MTVAEAIESARLAQQRAQAREARRLLQVGMSAVGRALRQAGLSFEAQMSLSLPLMEALGVLNTLAREPVPACAVGFHPGTPDIRCGLPTGHTGPHTYSDATSKTIWSG